MKQDYAIAAIRVSSTKQGLMGDSPEDQKQAILLEASKRNIKVKKFFEFIESASGEIQPSQFAIDYCKDKENHIKYFFIKSIDRFTRGGSYFYDHLKMQLVKYGVQLLDTYGVISSQEVNTLGHLNVKYPWSVYSPSRVSELLEAERAKSEVRDILSRMLSAEIRYVRMGFRVRKAPFGYQNFKIDTDHGKRVILEPHPIESSWIIRMFELRAQGNMSDEQIIKQINKMGFRTRIMKKRDPENRTKVIGEIGGKKLYYKQFLRYIYNPIYCGVNNESWTNGNPVKMRSSGLVSIDLFNRANRGKIVVVEEGSEIQIHKDKPPSWRLIRNKDNPLYPYRRFVLCPFCGKMLLGSASTGKSGKKYPAYHCHRKHYFRVPKKDLESLVEDFASRVEFNPEFVGRFKKIVFEEWEKRRLSARDESISYEKQVLHLKEEAKAVGKKIKMVNSENAIKILEEELDDIEQQIAQTIQRRDKQENKELDIQSLINLLKYYMEHLDELLLGGDDQTKNAAMFGLLFEELPTYEDLKNGTPNLCLLFRLNDSFEESERQCVTPKFLS